MSILNKIFLFSIFSFCAFVTINAVNTQNVNTTQPGIYVIPRNANAVQYQTPAYTYPSQAPAYTYPSQAPAYAYPPGQAPAYPYRGVVYPQYNYVPYTPFPSSDDFQNTYERNRHPPR